jgi:hypothetical protein
VTTPFWQSLYSGTALWKDRSAASICRYALHELFVETFGESSEAAFPLPRQSPVKGPHHLQVKATTLEEKAMWEALAQHYGSGAAALGIALQYLHDSFNYEDPEVKVAPKPAPIVGGVTASEVARWRKRQAVSM